MAEEQGPSARPDVSLPIAAASPSTPPLNWTDSSSRWRSAIQLGSESVATPEPTQGLMPVQTNSDESIGPRSLADEVVVVTGASSGIGEATARRLGSLGARLVITGRREESLLSVAQEIDSNGGQVEVVVADLRNDHELLSVFDHATEKWGRLDALVNSAGVGIDSSLVRGATNEWRLMFEVNVLALAMASREALARFDPRRGGHIVNVGSTSGHRVPPGAGFYAATKHAVVALTEALRSELATAGSPIRISLVSPGRVLSEMFGEDPSRQRKSGELMPDDVAQSIVQVLEAPTHISINNLVIRALGQVR
jgi:NADP-dependent 3-hydroxy acid dehydrogenase YdfG